MLYGSIDLQSSKFLFDDCTCQPNPRRFVTDVLLSASQTEEVKWRRITSWGLNKFN